MNYIRICTKPVDEMHVRRSSLSEKFSEGAAGGLFLNPEISSPLLTNGLRLRTPLKTVDVDQDSIATENFERTFAHLLIPDLATVNRATNAEQISFRGRGGELIQITGMRITQPHFNYWTIGLNYQIVHWCTGWLIKAAYTRTPTRSRHEYRYIKTVSLYSNENLFGSIILFVPICCISDTIAVRIAFLYSPYHFESQAAFLAISRLNIC